MLCVVGCGVRGLEVGREGGWEGGVGRLYLDAAVARRHGVLLVLLLVLLRWVMPV